MGYFGRLFHEENLNKIPAPIFVILWYFPEYSGNVVEKDH